MTTITNNKLTDETLKAWKNEAIISLGETPKDCRDYSHHEAILALVTELQERRKADNQEPAGYHVIKECGKVGCSVATLEEAEKTRDFWNKKWTIRPYFYTALPASERERIRREHAEWSDASFGDVGPIGPLKHLSKEALEAAADPSDPLEWADMQFLLWDAQRRAGISDEQITLAMVEKLAVNKKREWPEPKDGEPRLHIKEQPAPVVPDEMATSDDMNLYQKSFAQGWNACRAAMLQGGQPVSNRDELSSPVIPDGYALVPIVPTEYMVINGFESEPDPHFSDEKVWAEYEALSGCRRAARRAELCWAAMIKAAPKQEGNNG